MARTFERTEPERGVYTVHPKYGEIELLDKLVCNGVSSYWIVADKNGELRIADESDMDNYYAY